jgi:hypothetical protein
VAALDAREHEPQHEEPERHRREHEQRVAPVAERMVERHRRRRRQRRTDVDPGRVDTGREHRPVGEALLPEAHADPDRNREQDDERRPRHERPRDPEDPDQRERGGERMPRAEPLREECRGRSEEAHAQDGDRPEQAGDRVRRAEIVLDRRDERADPDELRPQCERGEEERCEKCSPPHSTTVS